MSRYNCYAIVDWVHTVAPRAGQHGNPGIAIPKCQIDARLADTERSHLRIGVSDDYRERLQELGDGLPIARTRLQRETAQSNHTAWRRLRERSRFPVGYDRRLCDCTWRELNLESVGSRHGTAVAWTDCACGSDWCARWCWSRLLL